MKLIKKIGAALAGASLLAANIVGVAAFPVAASAATATPPAPAATVSQTPPARSSGDWQPQGQQGHKQLPSAQAGGAKSSGVNSLLSTNYWYAGGRQTATTAGAYANVTIASPTTTSGDHSLAEIAVEDSTSGQQVVEVGWNVDPGLYSGSTAPHLFVYHWVNGVGTCYNGCGFVAYSGATYTAGQSLSSLSGTAKQFGIQYDTATSAWWVAFNGTWVGYFPASLWSSPTFTQGGYNQLFGEVASTNASTCTDMGNGLFGSNASAAVFGSTTYVSGPTVSLTGFNTNASRYSVNMLSGRTFQYGGPGAC